MFKDSQKTMPNNFLAILKLEIRIKIIMNTWMHLMNSWKRLART